MGPHCGHMPVSHSKRIYQAPLWFVQELYNTHEKGNSLEVPLISYLLPKKILTESPRSLIIDSQLATGFHTWQRFH
jgi:hypothetical protein